MFGVSFGECSSSWYKTYVTCVPWHSSIKVTETYLKPFENEKVDIANDELIISVVAHNGEKEVAWGISYDSHSNKRRITYQVMDDYFHKVGNISS